MQLLLLLGLLLQPQEAANGRAFYVADFSYDRLDCQTGKKIAKDKMDSGTLLALVSAAGKQMQIMEVASGRQSCIKAREKDLLEVHPVRLEDGTIAEFLDASRSVEPPRMSAPSPRAALYVRDSDADTMLPDVILIFAIAADGKVQGCRILRSSRSTGWDDWARSRTCGASYDPATRNSGAVAVTLIQRIPVGRR